MSDRPETFECPICYDHISKYDGISNTCAHDLCVSCVMAYLKAQYEKDEPPCCALCREPMYVLECSNRTICDNVITYMKELAS